jgi:hypothetical protein
VHADLRDTPHWLVRLDIDDQDAGTAIRNREIALVSAHRRRLDPVTLDAQHVLHRVRREHGRNSPIAGGFRAAHDDQVSACGGESGPRDVRADSGRGNRCAAQAQRVRNGVAGFNRRRAGQCRNTVGQRHHRIQVGIDRVLGATGELLCIARLFGEPAVGGRLGREHLLPLRLALGELPLGDGLCGKPLLFLRDAARARRVVCRLRPIGLGPDPGGRGLARP